MSELNYENVGISQIPIYKDKWGQLMSLKVTVVLLDTTGAEFLDPVDATMTTESGSITGENKDGTVSFVKTPTTEDKTYTVVIDGHSYGPEPLEFGDVGVIFSPSTSTLTVDDSQVVVGQSTTVRLNLLDTAGMPFTDFDSPLLFYFIDVNDSTKTPFEAPPSGDGPGRYYQTVTSQLPTNVKIGFDIYDVSNKDKTLITIESTPIEFIQGPTNTSSIVETVTPVITQTWEDKATQDVIVVLKNDDGIVIDSVTDLKLTIQNSTTDFRTLETVGVFSEGSYLFKDVEFVSGDYRLKASSVDYSFDSSYKTISLEAPAGRFSSSLSTVDAPTTIVEGSSVPVKLTALTTEGIPFTEDAKVSFVLMNILNSPIGTITENITHEGGGVYSTNITFDSLSASYVGVEVKSPTLPDSLVFEIDKKANVYVEEANPVLDKINYQIGGETDVFFNEWDPNAEVWCDFNLVSLEGRPFKDITDMTAHITHGDGTVTTQPTENSNGRYVVVYETKDINTSFYIRSETQDFTSSVVNITASPNPLTIKEGSVALEILNGPFELSKPFNLKVSFETVEPGKAQNDVPGFKMFTLDSKGVRTDYPINKSDYTLGNTYELHDLVITDPEAVYLNVELSDPTNPETFIFSATEPLMIGTPEPVFDPEKTVIEVQDSILELWNDFGMVRTKVSLKDTEGNPFTNVSDLKVSIVNSSGSVKVDKTLYFFNNNYIEDFELPLGNYTANFESLELNYRSGDVVFNVNNNPSRIDIENSSVTPNEEEYSLNDSIVFNIKLNNYDLESVMEVPYLALDFYNSTGEVIKTVDKGIDYNEGVWTTTVIMDNTDMVGVNFRASDGNIEEHYYFTQPNTTPLKPFTLQDAYDECVLLSSAGKDEFLAGLATTGPRDPIYDNYEYVLEDDVTEDSKGVAKWVIKENPTNVVASLTLEAIPGHEEYWKRVSLPIVLEVKTYTLMECAPILDGGVSIPENITTDFPSLPPLLPDYDSQFAECIKHNELLESDFNDRLMPLPGVHTYRESREFVYEGVEGASEAKAIGRWVQTTEGAVTTANLMIIPQPNNAPEGYWTNVDVSYPARTVTKTVALCNLILEEGIMPEEGIVEEQDVDNPPEPPFVPEPEPEPEPEPVEPEDQGGDKFSSVWDIVCNQGYCGLNDLVKVEGTPIKVSKEITSKEIFDLRASCRISKLEGEYIENPFVIEGDEEEEVAPE